MKRSYLVIGGFMILLCVIMRYALWQAERVEPTHLSSDTGQELIGVGSVYATSTVLYASSTLGVTFRTPADGEFTWREIDAPPEPGLTRLFFGELRGIVAEKGECRARVRGYISDLSGLNGTQESFFEVMTNGRVLVETDNKTLCGASLVMEVGGGVQATYHSFPHAGPAFANLSDELRACPSFDLSAPGKMSTTTFYGFGLGGTSYFAEGGASPCLVYRNAFRANSKKADHLIAYERHGVGTFTLEQPIGWVDLTKQSYLSFFSPGAEYVGVSPDRLFAIRSIGSMLKDQETDAVEVYDLQAGKVIKALTYLPAGWIIGAQAQSSFAPDTSEVVTWKSGRRLDLQIKRASDRQNADAPSRVYPIAY